ncbi:MAG: polar amino acid transport system permease protein [Actinomycetota bacterium]|jgi:polar amino acid transport system permease protein|nr:polar amino acid transport system permease protein [Actinomycetota bacterium]
MLGERRAVLVSTLSTIVFFSVIALVVALAPGFREVAHDFFDWESMKEAFRGTTTTPGIGGAFLLNIKMFVVAELLILPLALVIAVIRQTPGPAFFPLRLVAIGYTDFFRGVPLLLVIYIFGFGIPGLQIDGISNRSPVVLGVAALVLSYSAYVAEVYRAGIDSVNESQVAAARSLGLTRWQALRFVVLPQAVRRVIPPLLNDFISLQKDTALVAVLGPIEAARAAQIFGTDRFNYSSYVVAALLFILLTIPLARFTDHLIARDRRRRRTGAIA